MISNRIGNGMTTLENGAPLDVRQLAREGLRRERRRRRLLILAGTTATIAVIAALSLLLSAGSLPNS